MTRRDEILKLIVEYFIKTAEPVGSNNLLTAYKLDVSSATIRNEMNALERDGYLEKTHVSSGRVPTEKGYRYYVENLRGGKVDEKAKNALATVLAEKTKSVEEVIEESCKILSDMTNLVTVVLGQNVNDERLVSVQIIPLGEETATAVFVTDKGYVESKTFLLQKDARPSDIARTVKLLNDRLSGTPVGQLVEKMESMRPALSDYVVGQELLFDAILASFAKIATQRMESFGKETLYSQPEYSKDAERLKELISFLDDPERIKQVLEMSKMTSSGVNLAIQGTSSTDKDLALLSTKVNVPGGSETALVLLGPSRMDYERVVATLKYFTEEIDEYFLRQTKGDKEWEKTKETSPKRGRGRPKKK